MNHTHNRVQGAREDGGTEHPPTIERTFSECKKPKKEPSSVHLSGRLCLSSCLPTYLPVCLSAFASLSFPSCLCSSLSFCLSVVVAIMKQKQVNKYLVVRFHRANRRFYLKPKRGRAIIGAGRLVLSVRYRGA